MHNALVHKNLAKTAKYSQKERGPLDPQIDWYDWLFQLARAISSFSLSSPELYGSLVADRDVPLVHNGVHR